MADSAPQLLELHQAILDTPTLDALFDDLRRCTTILSVLPKSAAQAYAAGGEISLDAAREGLVSGMLRGVQVRYLYESQEWCDTLIGTAAGVRIVRMAVGASMGAEEKG